MKSITLTKGLVNKQTYIIRYTVGSEEQVLKHLAIMLKRGHIDQLDYVIMTTQLMSLEK